MSIKNGEIVCRHNVNGQLIEQLKKSKRWEKPIRESKESDHKKFIARQRRILLNTRKKQTRDLESLHISATKRER